MNTPHSNHRVPRLLPALSLILLPSTINAQVTTGARYEFDASIAGPGIAWTNTGSNQAEAFDGATIFGAGPTLVNDASVPGIGAAYNLTAIAAGTGAGANGNPSAFDGPGAGNATFEFWADVQDLATNQIIGEFGGSGRGVLFAIDSSGNLEFFLKGTAPQSVSAPITTGWHQILGTYNDVAGLVELYIDGTSVANATNTGILDWAGGNEAGLGNRGGASHAGGSNTFGATIDSDAPFLGRLSAFRFYTSVLSQEQITANSNALTTPIDSDDDGIDNIDELNTTGTDPYVADSDDDGLLDGEEDLNQDGNLDPGETDPDDDDTDNDSLLDGDERNNGLDPRDGTGDNGATGDPDEDLLQNSEEITIGSDPLDPDTDNDGLLDGFERTTAGLAVLNRDSDNDGLSDGFEFQNNLDFTSDDNADFTAGLDVFSDADEVLFYKTDPANSSEYPGIGDSPAPGSFTPVIQSGSNSGVEGAFDTDDGLMGPKLINEVASGGSDFEYSSGVTPFAFIYPDAIPAAGSSVNLTGFAWVVTGSTIGTPTGEIRVSFYDLGANGTFEGLDQETYLGDAVASLDRDSGPYPTRIHYWNFETPVNFVSEGTGLVVKIESTSGLRLKGFNDATNTSGLWYRNDGGGQFNGSTRSRLSIGGTATPNTTPLSLGISLDAGSPRIEVNAIGSLEIDLYRSTSAEPGSWGTPVATGLENGETFLDTNAPIGTAFYIGVTAGSDAP